MRIGIYHDAAGTRHSGGIAIFARRIAVELAEGHDVFLYTRDGDVPARLEQSAVSVVTAPRFDDVLPSVLDTLSPFGRQFHAKVAMATWGYYNGLVEHIDEHVDVLLTFQYLDDLMLSNVVDVPTVYEFHSFDQVGLGAKLRDRFSQTDSVLANSADTAKRVEAEFGYEVDDIVFPGVDLDVFQPDIDPAFSSSEPVVLFVGRLVESKGVFDLLEAVAGLDRSVELHLIGSGVEDRIRERCRKLGLAESVVFWGEVDHRDLPRYYAAADVFCLPSHAETFGMANIEAMACGLPVVTADLEGIRTYVDDGTSGFLVDVGDTESIATALERLLSDPQRRAEVGMHAREAIRPFSWRAQATRLEAFCADVVDDRSDDGREPESAVRPKTVQR
ncbi:glycosyltransferase family 4 protein [Natrinema ejinorense]|uniref:Glycosyl transferase group 1 n=1 Tax=Natrinema ejinorense TaxID=373386 RepID=A0A2A5QQQ0_9EURY|nr:glycosyltransferase family 4 protein [Natrinema ejinorense]PCR89142.1 glycosyl transferase group 1 [Natrinema ejinorense]